MLGSGPFWVWGLEHGVNEHGVVIGNEAIFTHEELELGSAGLLGMDLVRLGLERAASAADAVEVICALIECFGQGGRGFLRQNLGYSNGFLIADPHEAWSLQTSSRRWAVRRVRQLETLSNHPSIGHDWDRLSHDARSFAVERGWWPEEEASFDFEHAYRSTRLLSASFSDGRLGRSRALLEARSGRLAEADFFGLFRDHGGANPLPLGKAPADASYTTLCPHNDVQETATASLVVALDRRVRWFALGAPCTGVYLPLYLEGHVPAPLQRADAEPDAGSAWWTFHRLQAAVEADFERRQPRVRESFDALEAEWLGWPDDLQNATARMAEASARALEGAAKLLARFGD